MIKLKEGGLIYRLSTYVGNMPPQDGCQLFWNTFWNLLLISIGCYLVAAFLFTPLAVYWGVVGDGFVEGVAVTGLTLWLLILVSLGYWGVCTAWDIFTGSNSGKYQDSKLLSNTKELYKSYKNKYCVYIDWIREEDKVE